MVKTKKAATFIELIVTMLILTIIGSASVAFFVPVANILFYSPSQLMVDQTAQELFTILIEGDNQAKGLRFTKSITIADKDYIIFETWDNDIVQYKWDATEKRIYRKINRQGEALVPASYYLVPASYYGDITVIGQSSDAEIFQYYDVSASKLSVPVSDETDIEAIRMDLTLVAGSGIVKEHKGRIDVKSGVDIKQFGV
ncbi:MAG: hypothetical protein RAP41_04075 [Candidatus Orphnella occulta]|nr:hypothetical protein [Candidatus Orphnella occulta]